MELLPILTSKSISLQHRGRVFSSAVRGALLHASETWGTTVDDFNRLARNDHQMIRWICSSKLSDRVPMAALIARLGIPLLEGVMRQSRLRWFGHVERMDDDQWQRRILNHVVDGKYKGRPKKRWLDNVKDDIKLLGISKDLAADRDAWRASIKNQEGVEPQLLGQKRR